jgi:hypothetical protein
MRISETEHSIDFFKITDPHGVQQPGEIDRENWDLIHLKSPNCRRRTMSILSGASAGSDSSDIRGDDVGSVRIGDGSGEWSDSTWWTSTDTTGRYNPIIIKWKL